MTYDYLCTACGHEWEAEQRISEEPLRICPQCGKPNAKRQVTGGAGFILKGGGWYADGYASPKQGKANGKGSAGSQAKPDKAASSSGEGSKPEGTKSEATKSGSATPTA